MPKRPRGLITQKFIECQKTRQGNDRTQQPLADKPICVKLTVEDDAAVRAIAELSAWLRAAVREKLERDRLDG